MSSVAMPVRYVPNVVHVDGSRERDSAWRAKRASSCSAWYGIDIDPRLRNRGYDHTDNPRKQSGTHRKRRGTRRDWLGWSARIFIAAGFNRYLANLTAKLS